MVIPKFPGTDIERLNLKIISPESLAIIALKCALELERMHHLGYVHEDLKCNNFVCNFFYEFYHNQLTIVWYVWLIDLDACIRIENAKTAKIPLCNIVHAAPEIYPIICVKSKTGHYPLIVKNESFTFNGEKTDIYALGIVLLEIFATRSFRKHLSDNGSLCIIEDGIINEICADYELSIGGYLETFINRIPEDRCPPLLKSFLRRMVSRNPDGSLNPNPNDRPSIEETVATLSLHQAWALTPKTTETVTQLYQANALTEATTNIVILLHKGGALTLEAIKTIIQIQLYDYDQEKKNLPTIIKTMANKNALTLETTKAVIRLYQANALTEATTNVVIQLHQAKVLTPEAIEAVIYKANNLLDLDLNLTKNTEYLYNYNLTIVNQLALLHQVVMKLRQLHQENILTKETMDVIIQQLYQEKSLTIPTSINTVNSLLEVLRRLNEKKKINSSNSGHSYAAISRKRFNSNNNSGRSYRTAT